MSDLHVSDVPEHRHRPTDETMPTPPVSTPADHDPIRDEVERVLRHVVDVGLAVPVFTVGLVRQCVMIRAGSTGDRLAAPVRLVRSLLDALGAAGPTAPPPVVAEPVRPDVPAPVRMPGGEQPEGDDLPIEEYESLAASHVVARLGQLDAGELRRVRDFELAHRGRRTVLGKIEQLLASA